jgi:HEAT repeat protein
MRRVAHTAEIQEIIALLHDARSRRDGWPNTLRVDEAARLAALLRLVPVLELASIDWSFDYYSYPPAPADRWVRLLEKHASLADSWAWFAISTLDRSGFVRQSAVEALGRNAPVEAVPFLVLRTSDWVPQVRTIAEAVVDHCLKRFRLLDLLPALEVALQGEARVTGPRAAGARAVRERLQAAPDEVLVAGVNHGAVRSQRWCLRELLARRSLLLPDALRVAFRSSSTVLRFEAATALGHVTTQARGELLGFALADRVGFVRRTAAEAIAATELREADLEHLLLDSNRAARDLAQREWLRRHRASAAGWYRERLSARRATARAAALLGLAEVGEEDDAAEAVVRLDDPSWRVRLVALRCVSTLAPGEAEAAALAALADSSHKVVTAAASICVRHPSPRMQAKAEQLIFSPDGSRHRTGMRLLRAGEVAWQAEILDRLLRSGPEVQPEALASLEKLVMRRLAGRRLPQALLDRLAAAVNACELPPEVGERGLHADWTRRRRGERQRDRILFGLRSGATA